MDDSTRSSRTLHGSGVSGHAPKDILGRPVVTAADLDAMTPAQRKAAFEASIVTDLGQLPPGYLARLIDHAERTERVVSEVIRLAEKRGHRAGYECAQQVLRLGALAVEHEQIGTVEILRTRVYRLDPQTEDHPLATEVVVAPGVYPLYRQYDAFWWMMTGYINGRGSTKIGDDLFMMGGGDRVYGPAVTFPSRRYGLEQWSDFLAEDVCTEGHSSQRLRISVPGLA